MIKNKTEHIENDFKLINEKYYLYDKSKDLKRIILLPNYH